MTVMIILGDFLVYLKHKFFIFPFSFKSKHKTRFFFTIHEQKKWKKLLSGARGGRLLQGKNDSHFQF